MSTETQITTTEPAESKKPLTPIAMDGHGVNFHSFDEMARFCAAVHASKLAPKGFDSPHAIMVAIQAGLELGLPPNQALQSIAVINGRPSLWGDACLALASSRPDFEDIQEVIEADKATCTIRRKGRTPVVRTFTEADAKRAGLWGKSGPWTQYPARMLQMRARSWALRDAFPDALRGVGIREEQQDIPRAEARVVASKDLHFADETPAETLTLEAQ